MAALNLFNDGERIFNFDVYKILGSKNQKKDVLLLRKD